MVIVADKYRRLAGCCWIVHIVTVVAVRGRLVSAEEAGADGKLVVPVSQQAVTCVNAELYACCGKPYGCIRLFAGAVVGN